MAASLVACVCMATTLTAQTKGGKTSRTITLTNKGGKRVKPMKVVFYGTKNILHLK